VRGLIASNVDNPSVKSLISVLILSSEAIVQAFEVGLAAELVESCN